MRRWDWKPFRFALSLGAVGLLTQAARAAGLPAHVARHPVTYYVDPVGGSDSNSGQSAAAPWRTLHRVEQGSFRGGDRILLRGGVKFDRHLYLGRGNVRATSSRSPLVISSYGPQRAVLAPGRSNGIVVLNYSGIRISNLDIVGASRDCHLGTDGILIGARRLSGTLSDGITISHVDVHGFCDGIVIASDDDWSGIDHVRITAVSAHHNRDAGIITYDQSQRHHVIHDVLISDSRAYNNDEQGGIVLFGVDRARVTHSVAYRNGRGSSGAVGIWAFDSNRVKIDHNESYGNLTVGDDGDGFDLDAGVSNSVMEYNYSHDNAGIGFLLCACDTAYYAQHNDVIRYNVSQDDGRSGQASAVYVGGGQPIDHVEIYNNSFYSATRGEALVVLNGGGSTISRVHLRNNLLVVGGREPLLHSDTAYSRAIAIQGNDWWSASGRFFVRWGRLRFNSLASWRAVTGIERVGRLPVGLSRDPYVCRLGKGGTMFPQPPSRLRAYRLLPRSPLRGASLDLRRLFGIRAAVAGFSGASGSHNIGADQGGATNVC